MEEQSDLQKCKTKSDYAIWSKLLNFGLAFGIHAEISHFEAQGYAYHGNPKQSSGLIKTWFLNVDLVLLRW